MKTITYELALRALNEAVAKRGPKWVDRNAMTGDGCANVSLTGEPQCIVGTALVWLGVPPEWFLVGDRRCSSTVTIIPVLEREGVMLFSTAASRLLGFAQSAQDAGGEWGEAVVKAHLGPEQYNALTRP